MGRLKIPQDAFFLYESLGPERSYQAVANHYGISKRAVSKRATRERWQERLSAIEAKAREETLGARDDHRLRFLRAIQGKAIEGLKDLKFENAMDAVNAIVFAIQAERAILGEPTEIRAFTIEHMGPRDCAPRMLKVPRQPSDSAERQHTDSEVEGDGDDGGHHEDTQQARPVP